jgi:hypothetical protein
VRQIATIQNKTANPAYAGAGGRLLIFPSPKIFGGERKCMFVLRPNDRDRSDLIAVMRPATAQPFVVILPVKPVPGEMQWVWRAQ